ncbi:MAG: hypothetical protein ACLUEQ_09615 [Cloacibacillus evryensis]
MENLITSPSDWRQPHPDELGELCSTAAGPVDAEETLRNDSGFAILRVQKCKQKRHMPGDDAYR